MKWLADENFPFPAFLYLVENGLDVIHAGREFPSVNDMRIAEIAREENRILLTFDLGFGKMFFSKKFAPPPGVVLFRILDYTPQSAGKILIDQLADGFEPTGLFTVIRDIGIKRRPL